ncbi:MAG: COX15/CtaA family protein [Acidimicrobiales bacterium]
MASTPSALTRIPRLPPATYRRVTVVALVALAFIIVTGGAVRLTGSGLGCPQWPNCSAGHLAPRSASNLHPMIEFVNRVVTGVVSVAVIVAVLGALLRAPRRRDLTALSLGLVLGVIGQIVLGGETVRHRLDPAFVMAHFLLSMLIVWDAVVLHHRACLPDDESRRRLVDRDLVWVGRLLAFMTLVTVLAGTVVTGSGPHGGDDRVQRWSLDLHRVTQLHGVLAMVLVALAATTAWTLRSQSSSQVAQRRAMQVIEALGVQVVIGYTQYFTGVPAAIVGFHILGAVVVWIAVLRLSLALSSGAGLHAPGAAHARRRVATPPRVAEPV